MKRVIACRASDDYKVWLLFEDGVTGVVDLGAFIELETFRAIRSREAFRTVKIDDETQTIAWRGGVRMDPEILYQEITARWQNRRAR